MSEAAGDGFVQYLIDTEEKEKPMLEETEIQGVTPDQLQFDYDVNMPRELFMQQMQSQGYKIVLPADDELQIDIDSEEDFARFEKACEVMGRNWQALGEVTWTARPSKSGLPSRHITMKLPFKVEPWQRIALQACFGSDHLRELLSATRMIKGDVHPTMFVEPPQE